MKPQGGGIGRTVVIVSKDARIACWKQGMPSNAELLAALESGR
jgi:hypothetical protein